MLFYGPKLYYLGVEPGTREIFIRDYILTYSKCNTGNKYFSYSN